MDEEKTIDEAVEQADEMKEFEPVAFDEVIKETEPERKDAPILRDGGDPDPNMIHKHVDNFLAKIAGETPIDENVRDSTEYWLNRIAEAGGGGGGTTVLANPEMAGTEDALTGLQVGETKYKVPPYLYNHSYRAIKNIDGSDLHIYFPIVISIKNEAMTSSQFFKFLYDMLTTNNYLPIFGRYGAQSIAGLRMFDTTHMYLMSPDESFVKEVTASNVSSGFFGIVTPIS